MFSTTTTTILTALLHATTPSTSTPLTPIPSFYFTTQSTTTNDPNGMAAMAVSGDDTVFCYPDMASGFDYYRILCSMFNSVGFIYQDLTIIEEISNDYYQSITLAGARSGGQRFLLGYTCLEYYPFALTLYEYLAGAWVKVNPPWTDSTSSSYGLVVQELDETRWILVYEEEGNPNFPPQLKVRIKNKGVAGVWTSPVVIINLDPNWWVAVPGPQYSPSSRVRFYMASNMAGGIFLSWLDFIGNGKINAYKYLFSGDYGSTWGPATQTPTLASATFDRNQVMVAYGEYSGQDMGPTAGGLLYWSYVLGVRRGTLSEAVQGTMPAPSYDGGVLDLWDSPNRIDDSNVVYGFDVTPAIAHHHPTGVVMLSIGVVQYVISGNTAVMRTCKTAFTNNMGLTWYGVHDQQFDVVALGGVPWNLAAVSNTAWYIMNSGFNSDLYTFSSVYQADHQLGIWYPDPTTPTPTVQPTTAKPTTSKPTTHVPTAWPSRAPHTSHPSRQPRRPSTTPSTHPIQWNEPTSTPTVMRPTMKPTKFGQKEDGAHEQDPTSKLQELMDPTKSVMGKGVVAGAGMMGMVIVVAVVRVVIAGGKNGWDMRGVSG